MHESHYSTRQCVVAIERPSIGVHFLPKGVPSFMQFPLSIDLNALARFLSLIIKNNVVSLNIQYYNMFDFRW